MSRASLPRQRVGKLSLDFTRLGHHLQLAFAGCATLASTRRAMSSQRRRGKSWSVIRGSLGSARSGQSRQAARGWFRPITSPQGIAGAVKLGQVKATTGLRVAPFTKNIAPAGSPNTRLYKRTFGAVCSVLMTLIRSGRSRAFDAMLAN